jgi:hypothetical protein
MSERQEYELVLIPKRRHFVQRLLWGHREMGSLTLDCPTDDDAVLLLIAVAKLLNNGEPLASKVVEP